MISKLLANPLYSGGRNGNEVEHLSSEAASYAISSLSIFIRALDFLCLSNFIRNHVFLYLFLVRVPDRLAYVKIFPYMTIYISCIVFITSWQLLVLTNGPVAVLVMV